MMQFDAFWPPRLAELGLIQRDLGAAGSLRFPRLDAPAIQSLCLELAGRTNALRVRPVTGIVDAIAHATQKLVEPGSDLF
ncbi:MAG TPA: hypothetical protein VK864_14120, partial [Longimicrobiales bacterium]|nr:hypothetical protein [Longimicrobiales bacterium]